MKEFALHQFSLKPLKSEWFNHLKNVKSTIIIIIISSENSQYF